MTWEELAKYIMGLRPEQRSRPIAFCDFEANLYGEIGFGEFAYKSDVFESGDPVLYSKLMEDTPLITKEEDLPFCDCGGGLMFGLPHSESCHLNQYFKRHPL